MIAGAGLRSEGAPFGVQTAGPSRGSDDHVKIIPSVSIFVLSTFTLEKHQHSLPIRVNFIFLCSHVLFCFSFRRRFIVFSSCRSRKGLVSSQKLLFCCSYCTLVQPNKILFEHCLFSVLTMCSLQEGGRAP